MNQVLLVRIADRTIGVLAEYVRETVIIEQQSVVPGIAAILSGLITNRGRSIPIINLNRLLGEAIPQYNLALILEVENSSLALPIAEVIGYQTFEGQSSSDELFVTTEVAYKDVEILSISVLINIIKARLQVV